MSTFKWPKAVRQVSVVFAAMAILLSGFTFAQPVKAAVGQPGKDAAFVIDAHSGKVLYARNSKKYRFPASLTKVMTVYIMFEEMRAGRMSAKTRIKMTKRGAAQQPSKLGMRVGETITASDAIKALMVKSANDVAVAVAEHISGTEWKFAQRMTKTASRLGMKSTRFHNANGLPNKHQRTTARDMVKLGRAAYAHFPQYLKYFRLKSFTYKGQTFRNFNRLVGKVKGVDGFKTGYIRASGYNLLASQKIGNKHVIAVVMGGKTGTLRNQEMQRLLAIGMKKAKPSRKKLKAPVQSLALSYAPLPKRAPSRKPIEVQPFASSAASTAPKSSGEWSIQIGAVATQKGALSVLKTARDKMGSVLGSAVNHTPKVSNNNKTVYRARFAGLSKSQARTICAKMKTKNIDCFAVQ